MTPDTAIRLARRCAHSAQAPEWAQFVELVMPTVALSARRVCAIWGECSNTTVKEIVQEVFLKLCEDERRILRNFEDRGNESFIKLLRTITASVGTDYFRRNRAEKRGGRYSMASLDAGSSAKEVSDDRATEAVERPTLIAQLDGLLRLHKKAVSARDRRLFWLYHRQGLTAEAISKIPSIGLSRKGVESALLRMTRLLKDTILHGKPEKSFLPVTLQKQLSAKGFPRVIAIDSIKRR